MAEEEDRVPRRVADFGSGHSGAYEAARLKMMADSAAHAVDARKTMGEHTTDTRGRSLPPAALTLTPLPPSPTAFAAAKRDNMEAKPAEDANAQ